MESIQKTRGIIFSTVYYPFASGAEIAIKEITERLPHYEWDLITARLNPVLPVREETGRIVIHRVGVGHKTLDKFLLPILGFFKAVQLLRKHRYSLVWSMMASQASVAAAFLKMWRGRLRLVLTLQEGDEEEHLMRYVGGNEFLYRLFVRPWHTLVFKKADVITALSNHLALRAKKYAPSTPVQVIPNGVDLSVFTKVEPLRGPTTVLVTTSRLVLKNDVESVIRSLIHLPDSVHFWIIGTGELENSLRELVRELDLEDRVFFLGQLSHAEIADRFQRAHIFVRPSLTEGLGSSFLEAMAAGLPVIATPVGGIPDFVIDRETGLFVKVRNPESIAEAVRQLMDDPDLYERIRSTAHALVLQKYAWTSVAQGMDERAFSGSHTLRVLIAASIYPPDAGGPATHAERAFEELPQEGLETILVSFRDIRVYPWGIRHMVYLSRLLRVARGVDVLYAYDAVSVGPFAALVSWLFRLRFFVRIGGDRLWEYAFEKGITRKPLAQFYEAGQYKNLLLFRLIRWTLGRADVLIVPSETTASLYRRYYGVTKIQVIPNPVPNLKMEGNVSHPPVLLFVSRLVGYKNLGFVIDVLVEMKKRGYAFQFLICGDGPERESLVRHIEEVGIGDRVKLLGYVEKAGLVDLYKKAYATIAPALTEFHPNYVLDGVAYGKPFLISRGHAFPFSVPEEFVFDPQDKKDFEEKLSFLLSETGYERAQALLRAVTFSYTWKENIRDTAVLIKKICAF